MRQRCFRENQAVLFLNDKLLYPIPIFKFELQMTSVQAFKEAKVNTNCVHNFSRCYLCFEIIAPTHFWFRAKRRGYIKKGKNINRGLVLASSDFGGFRKGTLPC
ncbi:hypothetical protein O181_001888 [Austropuccinia psidii MF-1]|uniref:Uncharacterized protein n=1 Tax=Austropuccinia psidii MF-1 TaxID=1389203 RepID=A0A9Q3GC49_9BASI|nr:hypothetical protein [Austropuccinia psidii MF-1]